MRASFSPPPGKGVAIAKKGSVTSVQAVYVLADDVMDPAPATNFAHLDAARVVAPYC